MLAALLRYPKRQRRAVAREWAYRSHAVQAASRAARSPDPDTRRWRALHDARGQIIAAGCVYYHDRVTPWRIVRSLRGRVDQVDLILSDQLYRTGSLRTARLAVKFGKWRSRTVQRGASA